MANPPSAWADTPFHLISETGALDRPDIPKDHSAVYIARQMSQIHNGLIRALNSIHNQCIKIKPSTADTGHFLSYCQIFHDYLHSHHTLEERVIFPDIEQLAQKPGMMEANIKQHRDFGEAMETFRSYVFTTKPESYDGVQLQGIVQEFGAKLHKHLREEIPTLLGLWTLDDRKLRELVGRADKAAEADIDPFRMGPMVLGCIDKTFKVDGVNSDFPSTPFFLGFAVQHVFSRRHAGAWKFHPCTFARTPRPLYLS